MLSPDEIARVCYDTITTYREVIGEEVRVSWNDAPDDVREGYVEAVKFLMAGGLGLLPGEQHDRWRRDMADRGWKFGEDLDPTLKEHPNMVPWVRLPSAQRVKDALFGAIVKAICTDTGV